jgi:hypothetical protein
MNRRGLVPVALAVIASAGCFHQVVQTGRPPGQTVIDKPWVSTWIWGLVAAEPIEAQPLCPSGIATVTTEMSFLNGLASVVTLGIYSPQHVMITCASGRAALPSGASEMRVPVGATLEQRIETVNQAIQQASETHAPVILRF